MIYTSVFKAFIAYPREILVKVPEKIGTKEARSSKFRKIVVRKNGRD